MSNKKAQGHGASLYRRHLQVSIGKNSFIVFIYAGVFASLANMIYAYFNATFYPPLTLLFLSIAVVGAILCWPNFLYAILLPYTEWKMYKRDYLQLNRVYRFVLALPPPVGLSSYAEIAARCNLGLVQLQMGNIEEAEDIFRVCLGMVSKLKPGSRHKAKQLYSIYVSCSLAVALCQQEKWVEAELLLADVLDTINNRKISAGMYEGYAYYLLGHVHLGLKESTAEPNLLRGMKLVQNAQSSYSVREHSRNQMVNACKLGLARVCMESARIPEGNTYCDGFFADLEQGNCMISPLAVRDLNLLAAEYLLVHDYTRAEKILQLCYSLMSPTPYAPLAKQTLAMYEALLTETGRVAEISDLKIWLHPVSLLSSIG